MDKSYCSSQPDPVISFMSAEPVDSRTQVTASRDTEQRPLTTQSGGASSEPVLVQNDTGDGCDDEWKKVSYFNPTTGTSIIKITSEMFKKSRAGSVRVECNSPVEFKDSNQRRSFDVDSHNVSAGGHVRRSGHEVPLSSGAGSRGAEEEGCFGEVGNCETARSSGHSLDILGNGKVEPVDDKYSSDILFIDEPDYDCEEKVVTFIDDNDEQATWESRHEVKETTAELNDSESSDVFKKRSFNSAQPLRKESSFQVEKLRGDLAEACVDKDNKMETDNESAESGVRENDYRRSNVVTDFNKTTNISKSLNAEGSDNKSRISPGPLRLTRLAKSSSSSSAQPEYSYSTPSFFSAYPASDVNINSSNTCQTTVSSVSSILSLDSRSSSREEGKGGWTRDRGLFGTDLPESSCRDDAADSWAELEDLPAQSFEMRAFCPEKMSSDDLPLSSASDKPSAADHREPFIGTTSHYVPSSHVELNQEAVGQGQSEKLRLMQERKEKKQSRLKAGVIDSGKISGNKGDRSIEELLEFINSKKETEHNGKSRKTTTSSQKVKKNPQQVVAPPNPGPLNFTIKVTVVEEVLYNWQTPDASRVVSNGFGMCDGSGEGGGEDVMEADNSVTVIEKSNDSYSVTIFGGNSNGLMALGESGACGGAVGRSGASPSSSDAFAVQEEGVERGGTVKPVVSSSANGIVVPQAEGRECGETVSVPEASPSSNGFPVQEGSGDCTESVSKPEASPSAADAIGTAADGIQKSSELGGTTRVEKVKRKGKSPSQELSSANVISSSVTAEAEPPSYSAEAEPPLTDAAVTGPSSIRSPSDSASEAVATDDNNDSNRDFTVVQKKKRNRNTEKSQSYRATMTEPSLDFSRSKTQIGRKVPDDSWKTFPFKHNQFRKPVPTADNRHPVHPAWVALLKDKPTTGEALGKSSSGDSSETSSVCSASVRRESTSFAKVASGYTASDANSQSVRNNFEAAIVVYKNETKTLQSAKDTCDLQLNAYTACSGNGKVSPHAVEQCHCSYHDDTVLIPTDDGSTKETHTTFTDTTALGSDLNKVSPPFDKVTSCHGSSHQDTTPSSATSVGDATRALGRSPVVFDTREKSRFLAPAGDIEFSFGFDADDEGTLNVEGSEHDSTAVLSSGAKKIRSNSVHCGAQPAPESANLNSVLVDINSNLPHFQGSIAKSAVIAFPSHHGGFPPGASSSSHVPLIYGSPHPLSLGVGYVVPVPVGIVPPFMTCGTSRPLPSAALAPHPAFEIKDMMASLPDVSSMDGASQKQQPRGADVCALDVPVVQSKVSPVALVELPSARSRETSKSEGRSSSCFDLAAAQAFLYSEFEAATAPGSKIIYLTADD